MIPVLLARLLSDTAITAITGNRIYAFTQEFQEAQSQAFITVQRVSGVPFQTMDDSGPGLRRTRIQIDCYGTAYSQADQLSTLVERRLRGWRQGVVQGSILEDRHDFTESYEQLSRTSIECVFMETT